MKPLTASDPEQVGHWRMHGRLGAGGMGVVYLAVHVHDRRVGALKRMRPELFTDATARQRFRREVGLLRAITAPCVAGVLDADPDADPPYLVTAFIPGPSLEQLLEAAGPLDEDAAVGFACGAAEALATVHRFEVVHRDLTARNVLLADDGPKIIDFGIAATVDATRLTEGFVGTPRWPSPQQVRGENPHPADDVFAWGGLVAFAASGELPFGPGAPEEVLYRVVHEAPRLGRLPGPLDELVPAALAKGRCDRPTAAELTDRLLSAQGEATAEDALARTWRLPTAERADSGAGAKSDQASSGLLSADGETCRPGPVVDRWSPALPVAPGPYGLPPVPDKTDAATGETAARLMAGDARFDGAACREVALALDPRHREVRIAYLLRAYELGDRHAGALLEGLLRHEEMRAVGFVRNGNATRRREPGTDSSSIDDPAGACAGTKRNVVAAVVAGLVAVAAPLVAPLVGATDALAWLVTFAALGGGGAAAMDGAADARRCRQARERLAAESAYPLLACPLPVAMIAVGDLTAAWVCDRAEAVAREHPDRPVLTVISREAAPPGHRLVRGCDGWRYCPSVGDAGPVESLAEAAERLARCFVDGFDPGSVKQVLPPRTPWLDPARAPDPGLVVAPGDGCWRRADSAPR